MKIVHIGPPWISIPPKTYGGTENMIHTLIETQVAHGHEVTLLAPGDASTSAQLVSFFPQSLVASGVPWSAPLKAYYHLQKAVEYVQTHHFDIMHTHLSSTPDMYLFPLTSNVRTPQLMTLHSYFPFDQENGWIGDADHYYMEWASKVPVVIASKGQHQHNAYPLSVAGIVHHGLLLEHFRPTVLEPEDFFVWLGIFVPEKGPHLAIEAARKARVPLVLAGIIDRARPESVSYFADKIEPHINQQSIQYIGPVDHRQKVDLLSRARGLLNPVTWDEPFGMVMIEAMAVGCPVIAFDRGATSELIANGQSGFLVHNLDEMIQAIGQVKQVNRHAVRLYTQKHFSADSMARNYTRIYQEIITTRT